MNMCFRHQSDVLDGEVATAEWFFEDLLKESWMFLPPLVTPWTRAERRVKCFCGGVLWKWNVWGLKQDESQGTHLLWCFSLFHWKKKGRLLTIDFGKLRFLSRAVCADITNLDLQQLLSQVFNGIISCIQNVMQLFFPNYSKVWAVMSFFSPPPCILDISLSPCVWENIFRVLLPFRTKVPAAAPEPLPRFSVLFLPPCETAGFSRKHQIRRVWFPAAGRRFYQ